LPQADPRCQDVETFPDPGGTNEGIRVRDASELLEGDIGLRVLVVDDHPAFRKALTSALRMVADIEVAGEAGGGVAACEEAEELRPDVVLMDLSMPDLSGIDAMKKIHETRPELPVVILTAHADDGVEREARDAGAVGFLAKGTGLQELVVTLQRATNEESGEPVL
jgi:DNA-binding NarL/FixJ family response regulator